MADAQPALKLQARPAEFNGRSRPGDEGEEERKECESESEGVGEGEREGRKEREEIVGR